MAAPLAAASGANDCNEVEINFYRCTMAKLWRGSFVPVIVAGYSYGIAKKLK